MAHGHNRKDNDDSNGNGILILIIVPLFFYPFFFVLSFLSFLPFQFSSVQSSHTLLQRKRNKKDLYPLQSSLFFAFFFCSFPKYISVSFLRPGNHLRVHPHQLRNNQALDLDLVLALRLSRS